MMLARPAGSRLLVLALAALALGAGACGGSQRWPAARALGDPAFVQGGPGKPIGSIDVLPVDLQVWTGPGAQRTPEELSGALQAIVGGMVTAHLAGRGYQVGAQMEWDGSYTAPDGAVRTAMTEADVAKVLYSLSSFGEAQQRFAETGHLLVPFLPARLGEATGSDATLYVGGWAFAGKDKTTSKAAKIAKVVFFVVVVAVVVAAVVACSKGCGGAGDAIGGIAKGTAQVASSAGRVAGQVLKGVTRIGVRTTAELMRSGDTIDLAIDLMDAMGRSNTHVVVFDHRPDYYNEGAPRSGRSAMQLEMTLVDNRTGHVLWHARQKFPARPSKPEDVERAVGALLAGLPAAR